MHEEEIHFGKLLLRTRNSFGTFDLGDLDLWPNDPKINRVPLLPRIDLWTKFEKVHQSFLQLLIGNGFGTFNHGDLDLWPSDPKIKASSATQDGCVDQV